MACWNTTLSFAVTGLSLSTSNGKGKSLYLDEDDNRLRSPDDNELEDGLDVD